MSEVDNRDLVLEQAANGNAEALSFMRQLQTIAHHIDDLVDEKQDGPWKMLEAFQETMTLFAVNPFFEAHKQALFPVILLAFAHYVQSVAWENQGEEYRKSRALMADHLRSDMNSVFELVSLITGGPARMREFIPVLRDESWATHHDAEGNPI
jgi:hypothetical protein